MGTLQKIRLSTLVQIAAGGFIAGSTALYLAQKSVQRKVRSLPHYNESLKIVAEHEKAKDALGPPIEIGNVDLADRKHNYVAKTRSMLVIPVSGVLDAGNMEVTATRDSEAEPFVTSRIRLHLQEGVVTIYDNGRWTDPVEGSQK